MKREHTGVDEIDHEAGGEGHKPVGEVVGP